MTKKSFNETPNFPYTYGDSIENDETRFSNHIVNLFQNKKFQKYVGALAYSAYCLGSQAAPAGAIPPEVGEGIANIAAGQAQANPQCVPGDIQGRLEMAANNLPLTGPNLNPGVIPNSNGYQVPKLPDPNNFPNIIPGPPTTPVWKTVNSVAFGLGIFTICLNGAWGNPFGAVVCAGAMYETAKSLLAMVNK